MVIDREPEHVGTVVGTGRIEEPLAGRNGAEIEIGHQDAAFSHERARYHITCRGDDDRVALEEPSLEPVLVLAKPGRVGNRLGRQSGAIV